MQLVAEFGLESLAKDSRAAKLVSADPAKTKQIKNAAEACRKRVKLES